MSGPGSIATRSRLPNLRRSKAPRAPGLRSAFEVRPRQIIFRTCSFHDLSIDYYRRIGPVCCLHLLSYFYCRLYPLKLIVSSTSFALIFEPFVVATMSRQTVLVSFEAGEQRADMT